MKRPVITCADIASHWFAFSKVTSPEVNKVKKRFRCFVRFKTCGRYFLFALFIILAGRGYVIRYFVFFPVVLVQFCRAEL